jgi:NAD(P)H-hydrate repair Nnr-like enzyme with NAD(P)H-hydrate dehydratase domain
MRSLIVGTVPYEGFPLSEGVVEKAGDDLILSGERFPTARGTPALIASAITASRSLGVEPPRALLAGDIGKGDGSASVYRRLAETMPDRDESLLVFHYLQPNVDWHNRVLIAVDDRDRRPILVADAGFMYVAKMSGFASSYDLFTPDVGEMAFIADESAPHPFYTRGFLLQEERRVPELIQRAYERNNAPKTLLVKGRCDYVAVGGAVIASVCEPSVETMEPIGGTGDTLTGLVAALIASGLPIPESSRLAALMNRYLGVFSNPTPAFSVAQLLPALPKAVETVLDVDGRGRQAQG